VNERTKCRIRFTYMKPHLVMMGKSGGLQSVEICGDGSVKYFAFLKSTLNALFRYKEKKLLPLFDVNML
jgi:hypothetical protein